ncbi:MAG: LamG-like jellyroll fold domain-containing protein, partial [Pseudomonadota bacterium]
MNRLTLGVAVAVAATSAGLLTLKDGASPSAPLPMLAVTDTAPSPSSVSDLLHTTPGEAGRLEAAGFPWSRRSSGAPSLQGAATGDIGYGPEADPQSEPHNARSDADSARAPRGKMGQALAALVSDGGDERVNLIAHLDAQPELFDAERLAALGGVLTHEYEALNMRAVSIPAAALEDLALDPHVTTMSLDRPVVAASASARATNNAPSHASPNAAFQGADVNIAILDSGVGEHEDLDNVEHVNLIAPFTRAVNGVRHDEGAEALYIFDENRGGRIFDRSERGAVAGTPADLVLESENGVDWDDDALTISAPTRAVAPSGAERVFDACTASNELTLEAWVVPGVMNDPKQTRIITFSSNTSLRNFTLAQVGTRYEVRIRTTTTGLNGFQKLLNSAFGTAKPQLQHVVAVRNAQGLTRLYIDGALSASTFLGGNFSNWEPNMQFGLTNEFGVSANNSGRDWQGEHHLAA